MKLFDNVLTLLERSLDVRLYRQGLLASNAANLDTPGYKPRDVDFGAAMRGALEGPAEGRATSLGGATYEQESAPLTPDGNAVDLDRTMVSLTENGLQYGAAARAAGKKLALLRYVATDGTA